MLSKVLTGAWSHRVVLLGLWLRGLPVQSRLVAQLPQALASALGTLRDGLRFISLRGGSQRKAVEGRVRRQRSFRPRILHGAVARSPSSDLGSSASAGVAIRTSRVPRRRHAVGRWSSVRDSSASGLTSLREGAAFAAAALARISRERQEDGVPANLSLRCCVELRRDDFCGRKDGRRKPIERPRVRPPGVAPPPRRGGAGRRRNGHGVRRPPPRSSTALR